MADTVVSVVVKTKGQQKLDQLQRSFDATTKKLDKLKGELTGKLQTAFERIGRAGINAGNKIKRGFETATKAATGFAKKVGGLRGQLLGLGVGAGLTKSFLNAADLESAQARVQLLTKNFGQLKGIQDLAAQSADKFIVTNKQALNDLIDLGNRLGPTGTTLEEIKEIYQGLNTVLALNKVSGEQAASVQLQLNQALGAGVLNGEEFNAVADNAPQLLDAVAKVLKVERSELKKLASQGKITREVLIKAFADVNKSGAKDLDGAFSGSFKALREFNKALKEFSTAVGEELLPVVTPLLAGVTDLLNQFAKLPGPLKTAAVLLTAVGTAAIFAAPAIAAVVKGSLGLLAALGAAKLGAAAAGVSKLALAFTGLKAAAAFLTGPVGLVIAGVAAVGVGAIAATKKINDFNDKINKTTASSSETAGQIKLVEERLEKLQGDLDGSGNSARGLRRQVEELKAKLEDLKGTYKVQVEIETLFTGQGAIFDGIKSSGFGQGNDNNLTYTVGGITYDAKTGKPVVPPKPVEVPKPIVPSGGGGGGGGGAGGTKRESQVPVLTRELSVSDKLLDNRQKILDADFEGNRMALMTARLNRINIELDSRVADIKAESIPQAEKDLKIQLAQNDALGKRLELEQQSRIDERDRKNSVDEILQSRQDELDLLQGQLDGNAKEIRDRIKIRDLAKELTDLGFDPAEAEARANAFVSQGNSLQRQLNIAKQLDSLYKGIGSTIENGIINAIDAGIDGLINGTKDLGKALQEIASGVLKDIASQLIRFGVKGLLKSTDLPFFADGGRPEIGKPAIVGEEGPELFIPDTAGTVISNDDAFGDAKNALVDVTARPADIESDEVAAAFSDNRSSLRTVNNQSKEREVERVFNEQMSTAGSQSTMTVKVDSRVINNEEFVTLEQFNKGVVQSAKAAEASVISALRNKPSVRRSVGM